MASMRSSTIIAGLSLEQISPKLSSIFSEVVSSVNATFLSLIPNPQRFEDYRPISLCNVIYKIISKILANRLKEILDQLISPNQAAFIKGRNIAENILLAHELVRNFHKDRGPAPFCVKVDLQKAYDKVSWNAVLGCLRQMSFPPNLDRVDTGLHFNHLLCSFSEWLPFDVSFLGREVLDKLILPHILKQVSPCWLHRRSRRSLWRCLLHYASLLLSLLACPWNGPLRPLDMNSGPPRTPLSIALRMRAALLR